MNNTILTEENIILNAAPADRFEAIRMTGDLLIRHGYVTPDYLDDMLEREKRFSVYIGNHVAIPHGLDTSRSNIIKSGISVVQTPAGVPFEEGDAYIFIGIAGKSGDHVEILQQIAMVCMDEDNVDKLRRAESKEEIMRILLDGMEEGDTEYDGSKEDEVCCSC
jgi:mannitol/fructose-specific phosphotransferase system IIA component